jgi:hypothetical protein
VLAVQMLILIAFNAHKMEFYVQIVLMDIIFKKEIVLLVEMAAFNV